MTNSAPNNPMAAAESTVRSVLNAGSPGDQMEGLMRAYERATDKPSFVAVLVGNLVSERHITSQHRREV